jgi:hypothetical protein
MNCKLSIVATLAAGLVLATSAQAQTAAVKPAAKASRSVAKKAPAKKVEPVEVALAKADGDQMAAAEMAYVGDYACELDQSVSVSTTPRHDGYVDVHFKKETWTMKPVLSSTGALRLEDVRGRMLMLQIANKSMLMDAKVGQRVVDGCVHEKQRMAMAAAAGQPPAAALLQAPANAPR